jgi:ankyrin repeat protein
MAKRYLNHAITHNHPKSYKHRLNQSGGTAMIHAAKNGHVSTVELLIDSNADPNIQDKVCIFKRHISSQPLCCHEL